METFSKQVTLIWNIADILRGGWKQHEYQEVILPLVVLKRLDSVLADTKEKVLKTHDEWRGKIELGPVLVKAAGHSFYNVSPYDLNKLTEDPRNIAKNFKKYLNDYSSNIRDIIEKFNFDEQIKRLADGEVFFRVIEELNKADLHPSKVDNHQMGYIFEELLRKFSEMSNETAGEHYTPRDVIEVMVEILLEPDKKEIGRPHIIKKIYDPACGTGGMLTVAKDHIHNHINKNAEVYLYGQELNATTYAVAKSDMLIKGEKIENIRAGDTLSDDQFFGEVFDYGLSNPPYGVDWKKDKNAVEREAKRGYAGRFGAGLPRISDGQLLFLQHLVSKMKPESDGGSRIAIVHNGSPLFTGDAGSGESEIRRWLMEKDLVEAIVALPDQLFYNTGINTYLWFLTNKKSRERKDKVQLIDAREFFKKTRKSLGEKRKELDNESKKKILDLYTKFEEREHSKIFNTTDFAYRQIQIERPLMVDGKVSKNKKGEVEIDKSLRDHENVPWGTDVRPYFEKEVKPFVADAWINESVVDHKDGKIGIVGYEIPFTRYFYKYEAPRSLEMIEADIEKVENELLELLKKL